AHAGECGTASRARGYVDHSDPDLDGPGQGRNHRPRRSEGVVLGERLEPPRPLCWGAFPTPA
ncbi:hypothetical protein, partial [Pseudonocardia abyssalis]|uniref:hypothetical protein n=1 Tax=Pseudonocardia abyssalis TaxID=2792008 RepID=UPI001C49F69B